MPSLFELPNTTESLSPLALPLPSGTSRHLIKDGVKGTEQTIALMQKLVNSGKRSIKVRKFCGEAISSCAPKDYYDYAKKCYEKVRDEIKYAYDPHLVEFCESADHVLNTKIGDCDSMDILLASMFENLGMETQFVTIKADDSRPDEFTHVYTRVNVPKVGWVNADPIMPDKTFGWEAPYPNGRRYWHSSADELNQTLDTSDSTTSGGGGAIDLGISGLSHGGPNWDNRRVSTQGLGHGGHHGGGGGRGWRGGSTWNNWGYGGPDLWSSGFDDNVVVMQPIVLPSTALLQVVPTEDVTPQSLNVPDDKSHGVGMLGLKSLNDGKPGMGGIFSDAIDKVKGTLGIPPPMSDNDKRYWVTKVFDGSLAKDLNDRRARVNAVIDAAGKQIIAANKLLDTNPNKAVIIAGQKAIKDAAFQENYAINATMAKYNELRAFIGGATGDFYNIQALNGLRGMGAVTWPITAIVISVAASWIVYQMAEAYKEVQLAHENTQQLTLKNPNMTPQQMVDFSKNSSLGPVSDAVDKFGSSALKFAAVVGGAFVLYKLIDAMKNRSAAVA